MPYIAVEIPNTYMAITRPVTVEVARSLIKTMGLPTDTGIDFFGSSEAGRQIGSEMEALSDNRNRFPYSGRINIEVTEEYIEDRTLSTAVKRKDNLPYFIDRALRIIARPVYVGTEATISFRYRAKDRASALKWRDEFQSRAAQGRGELLHEINYHYGIPPEYLIILSRLHALRESQAGYGEDLATWLRKCLTNKTTKLTTQAGTEPRLVVAEQQIGVLGWFDFVAYPSNPERAGEGGAWEAGFDYKFQYDKVTATTLQYPLVIHSQVVDDDLYPSTPVYKMTQRDRLPSYSRFLFDGFTDLYKETPKCRLGGVMIPSFDEWVPRYVAPWTSTLLVAMIATDPNDPRDVLNLNQLGDHYIDPTLAEFMQGEAPFMHLQNQSVFNVGMFLWDVPLEDITLTVDSDLNVRTTYDMSLRENYHFRLAITNDYTTLAPNAIERLRNNGLAALELIKLLDPSLCDSCYSTFYQRLGHKPEVKISELFDDIYPTVDPNLTMKDLFCLNRIYEYIDDIPAYKEIQSMMNALLQSAGMLPKLLGGRVLPMNDLIKVFERISRVINKDPSFIEYRLKTVGQYVIVSRSKDV